MNAQVTPIQARKPRPIMVEAERLLLSNLSVLRPYMDDPKVTEIMVNSPDTVFVEFYSGMKRLDGVALSENQIESCIHAIMRLNSKVVSPIMDARLPGFRVAAALPPVAIHGPMLVIRKHASRRFKLQEYVDNGSFAPLAADQVAADKVSDDARLEAERLAAGGGDGLLKFFSWAVRARKNILVVGGTSSGKTTFAASLLLEVPATDRVITCEDTHELILEQPNVVQLEGLALGDPANDITIRHLIRLCLRSRPDRIVVGELRGPEAYDFIDAMNTGHSGSVCTLHANSAPLGLQRLESLIRMSPTAANLPLSDMRSQIASAVDYVVFQSRLGGLRAPQEVLALDGVDDSGNYVSRLIFSRVRRV